VTDDPVGASEWTMMIGRAESVATAIRRNSAATVLTCRIPVIGTAWRAEPGAPTLGRRRGQHPCRGTAPQGGENGLAPAPDAPISTEARHVPRCARTASSWLILASSGSTAHWNAPRTPDSR